MNLFHRLQGVFLLGWALTVSAEEADLDLQPKVPYRHGYAFLKEPELPPDFAHLSYVVPDAPKGGQIRIPQMGNWDSFNPVPPRGRVAAGLSVSSPTDNLLLDALMEYATDEISAIYGLVAEGIAIADDQSWIAFKLREGARWHDGKPITVEDLVFSFETYRHDANPAIKNPLLPFTEIEVLNDREVKYHISESERSNPLLPMRIGTLAILPKHYWEAREIKNTTVDPPLGSGPYKISDFYVGQWIKYERVEDYWAKDLPVNKGRFNFDEIKFDYFRDDQVQTESLKGNAIDVHVENIPRYWEQEYDFKPAELGIFKKAYVPQMRPAGLWWPIFWNLEQPRFQDVRVREALWLVNDFVFLNKRNYNFYGLATSFFEGSPVYAARGLPDERELRFLEPIRDLVPPRVFTHEYQPPPKQGNGWDRETLHRAQELLKEAGWVIKDDKLFHEQTGEQFHIRFVAVSPALGSSFIHYSQVLERLGISSTIKSPEISNWLYRMRSGDFDAGAIWFLPDNTPTATIDNFFNSALVDQPYSSNWANIADPAIDYLIEAIKNATEFEDYAAAIRALDRVLLWNFYFVPGMAKTKVGIAYWNRFGHPQPQPLTRITSHVDLWWWDEEKAAAVREYAGRQ